MKQFTEGTEDPGPTRGAEGGSGGSGSIEADPGTHLTDGSGTHLGPTGTHLGISAETPTERCPLHGDNAHPDACFTCAKLAGRGWDE